GSDPVRENPFADNGSEHVRGTDEDGGAPGTEPCADDPERDEGQRYPPADLALGEERRDDKRAERVVGRVGEVGARPVQPVPPYRSRLGVQEYGAEDQTGGVPDGQPVPVN